MEITSVTSFITDMHCLTLWPIGGYSDILFSICYLLLDWRNSNLLWLLHQKKTQHFSKCINLCVLFTPEFICKYQHCLVHSNGIHFLRNQWSIWYKKAHILHNCCIMDVWRTKREFILKRVVRNRPTTLFRVATYYFDDNNIVVHKCVLHHTCECWSVVIST
jgi:hypothetical protein